VAVIAPTTPTDTVADEPPRRRRRSGAPRSRRTPAPYGLLLPALVVLAVALGYPLVRQVVLSFQEFGLAQQFGRPPEFVGLQNYRDLVGDPYLWDVVVRTIVFCLANAALTMVIGTGIALLMRAMSTPVRIAAQTALLLAWAMPVLASLTVWTWLFDTDYGVVNWVLTKLGGDYERHSWLLEASSFFLVATIVVVWMSVPFVTFTVYAALTGVPPETVEAAEVDGASAWQRFRHVIVPAIRPVLLVVGLLQVIWDLRVFTQIFVLQDAGGVTRDTNLLGTYVYRTGISEGDFGTASAAAIFMLLLAAVLTAPYVVRMLREERES
jgi:N,N'-diacetylchitobiose transport system permease protein